MSKIVSLNRLYLDFFLFNYNVIEKSGQISFSIQKKIKDTNMEPIQFE